MSHNVGTSVHFAYVATEGDSPRGTFHPGGNSIPALYLTDQVATMNLQWQPGDLANAIRYLRELAAVATDLADQVEQHKADREREIAEAVLLS